MWHNCADCSSWAMARRDRIETPTLALMAWRMASVLPISATTLNSWESSPACSKISNIVILVPEPCSRIMKGASGSSSNLMADRFAQRWLGDTASTSSSSNSCLYCNLLFFILAPTTPSSSWPARTMLVIFMVSPMRSLMKISGKFSLKRPMREGRMY